MKDYVDKPNRNTFDLSYQNNLTMEFGKLYPVFCKEVVPGDSMRIKPTFGLRFMPLVFPIQTRMQANLHFFYVRNRNLWKDWPDFIGRTKKDLVLPYLSKEVAKKVCKTRGLGDYFGLPTTIVGEYGSKREFSDSSILSKVETWNNSFTNYALSSTESIADSWANGLAFSTVKANTDSLPSAASSAYRTAGSVSEPLDFESIKSVNGHRYLRFDVRLLVSNSSSTHFNRFRIDLYTPWGDGDYRQTVNTSYEAVSGASGEYYNLLVPSRPTDLAIGDALSVYKGSGASAGFLMSGVTAVVTGTPVLSGSNYVVPVSVGVDLDDDSVRWIWLDYNTDPTSTKSGSYADLISGLKELYGTTRVLVSLRVAGTSTSYNSYASWADRFAGPISMDFMSEELSNQDISNFTDRYNPYANGDIKISALPFRAYESIYNAFYRNQFNDPFTIDGVKEYNKFITTDEGGEDSTPYDICYRNYEQDFLTSAKQSPVDGDITPLVGVSGTGTFTFQNADGSQVNITPKFAEDGNTIIGLETVEGTPENTSSIRRLMDMASVGISINDFRNVNALQRWLETNLRRGYRYKDQLLSHFGVDAKFDVLDMPEFIGGMSEPVLVNQINQNVDQTGDPSGLGDFSKVLGSFAGQASVLAQSRHNIEKYCDEHGFIIGILSITPVPNYSQLLPKFFLKSSVLDYYFPEFGHIGNQPIPYSEVCPLQSYIAGDKLTDVFGYQRAWYDYLASVDEVHGDFRTSLEGFLINRVFDVRPELGKDFLQVTPDDMSNPFSVTDDVDKILGQIYFEVTAQRPIPKFGIPRLE